jgi:hypothetical protein
MRSPPFQCPGDESSGMIVGHFGGIMERNHNDFLKKVHELIEEAESFSKKVINLFQDHTILATCLALMDILEEIKQNESSTYKIAEKIMTEVRVINESPKA